MVKFPDKFDFFENFQKFRFRSKFRKISILVKNFPFEWNFRKNYDFGQNFRKFRFWSKFFHSNQIFEKISILVKTSEKLRVSSKFRIHLIFSKISKYFDFGLNFRKISIFVKFSKKILISVNFLKKFRFCSSDFTQKFEKFRFKSNFSKNFNFGLILENFDFGQFFQNFDFGQSFEKFQFWSNFRKFRFWYFRKTIRSKFRKISILVKIFDSYQIFDTFRF